MKHIYSIIFFSFCFSAAYAQKPIVYINNQTGELVYKKDSLGNQVPDFSYVGYHQGEKEISEVPIIKTIEPVEGDNHRQIQRAIRQIQQRKPNGDGIRGGLLLKAGEYKVSDQLKIRKSGVVLYGEGSGENGTHLIATKKSQHILIKFQGKKYNIDTNSKKAIKNDYVPIGTKKFTIENDHNFKVGDRVILKMVPNQAWVELLGMDKLTEFDSTVINWKPTDYIMDYKRKVIQVKGNQITIDAPVVDPINRKYAEGFLYKYSWEIRIEEVGIENMRLISEYENDTDENHGWNAIVFANTENGWARNVEAYHFGKSAVKINGNSHQISVINCKQIDPVSIITGSRRYSFISNGQKSLFKDCYARNGRHDYVSGKTVPGPNVFYNCVSEKQHSTTGPHQRWSTANSTII